MKYPELQKGFSKTFIKYNNSRPPRNEKHSEVEYPFSFLDYYLKQEDKSVELKQFETGFNFHMKLQNHKKQAYNCFEYELNLLDNGKYLYLNEVTLLLFKALQKIMAHQRKYKYLHAYHRTLSNIASNILKDIFMHYHLDLDSRNRDKLSKWFHLKEPIISFRFSKSQEEKRLYSLYFKHLYNGSFINLTTEFGTFKALFEGRVLENKINWIDNKSSLYYFIKLLVSNKVVKNPKNRHWQITAEFFLLKGETLLPNDFLNQKETQNKEKREALEKFVSALTK